MQFSSDNGHITSKRVKRDVRQDSVMITIPTSRNSRSIRSRRRKRNIRHNTITMTRNDVNSTFETILPHCPYLREDKYVLLCERHYLRLHERLQEYDNNCTC